MHFSDRHLHLSAAFMYILAEKSFFAFGTVASRCYWNVLTLLFSCNYYIFIRLINVCSVRVWLFIWVCLQACFYGCHSVTNKYNIIYPRKVYVNLHATLLKWYTSNMTVLTNVHRMTSLSPHV